MSNDKDARTTSNHEPAETPTSADWAIGYSRWENITNAAMHETVAAAEEHERNGWPYPISGDQTRLRYAPPAPRFDKVHWPHG